MSFKEFLRKTSEEEFPLEEEIEKLDEGLFGGSRREKNKINSKQQAGLHLGSSKEHLKTAQALKSIVDGYRNAAKNVPHEGQMKAFHARADEEEKRLSPIIKAHHEAAIAHHKASAEHVHVIKTYNGHPDAHKDAMKLTKAAHAATEKANNSHTTG